MIKRITSYALLLPITMSNTFISSDNVNINKLSTKSVEIKEEISLPNGGRTFSDEAINKVEEYIARKEEEARLAEIARLEEEARIKAEQERIAAEQARLEAERQKQIEANRMYVKFEVSFYTTAEDEGGYLGANGDVLQPWVSIATPPDIPFYSNVYIEGLGNFTVHDTGSYIKWATDNEGNAVCRVDVCVNSKEEAYRLGRYYAYGYIDLNR